MHRLVKAGLTATVAAALLASLGACAAHAATPRAPEPAKPIDPAKFYQGRWYEIARTPMKLTDGCVAGTTDYYTDAKGRLIDRDACRDTTPGGKEKLFDGPVKILSPANNKVSVRYTVFGIVPVSKTYWMIDHDDAYSWFMVTDPDFKTMGYFTRDPRPSGEAIAAFKARATALGYDISKLEYPAQFPPGEGQLTH